MRAVQACNPLSKNFSSLPALLPLVKAYDLDKDTIDMETKLAKKSLEKKNVHSISNVFSLMSKDTKTCPSILKFAYILL